MNYEDKTLGYSNEEVREVSCPTCFAVTDQNCFRSKPKKNGEIYRITNHLSRIQKLDNLKTGKKQEPNYNFPVVTRKIEETRANAQVHTSPPAKPKRRLKTLEELKSKKKS